MTAPTYAELVENLQYFAAGAARRHAKEGTNYSEGWLAAAHSMLELLGVPPLPVALSEESPRDTRPWCWRRPGNEFCEGPFDTREAAIHDARHGHAEEGLIEVGRCTPVLDAYPMIDAGSLCDMLNDNFCDMGLEGATAIVENVDEADEALRAWADKYLKVEGYEWVIADEEDVHPAFRKTSH
jgi:hypothetical protein